MQDHHKPVDDPQLQDETQLEPSGGLACRAPRRGNDDGAKPRGYRKLGDGDTDNPEPGEPS